MVVPQLGLQIKTVASMLQATRVFCATRKVVMSCHFMKISLYILGISMRRIDCLLLMMLLHLSVHMVVITSLATGPTGHVTFYFSSSLVVMVDSSLLEDTMLRCARHPLMLWLAHR